MTVRSPRSRALAAGIAFALGLGGALVVASPAAAASFTVTKNADDGTLGSLTYALANLTAGTNTITITATGPITIPGAVPVISEDVDIVGPSGGVTIETTDTAGHFAISNATVTMTDLDLRPNLGGIAQGIEVTDSNLTLTRVSVQGFDQGITASDSSLTANDVSLVDNVTIGLYFQDNTGTNTAALTNVRLGGNTGAHVQTGALIYGAGGAISLTNVTATFTDTAGIVLGSDVGAITMDTVTVEDSGFGIYFSASGGSVTNGQHITVSRSLAGLIVDNLDDAELHLTDLQVTDTDSDGVDITATNGSLATITASSVTASSGTGFILDATDSTIELSDSTSSGNGTGGGCGCSSGSGVQLYADNSTVTLDGLTSSGNTASNGAGVEATQLIAASIVTIANSTINGNTASGYGGGIEINDVEDSGTSVTIRNSTVSGNNAVFGGGISISDVVSGATIAVTGSTINGNTASDDGGGVIVDGIADDGTAVSFSDSMISGNGSGDFGAGLYLLDIGEGAISTAHVVVQRTTFDGNTAGGYGGGIAITEPSGETSGLPTVLIDSSTLSNNSTPYGGGGLYLGKYGDPSPAVIKVLNSTISGNSAQAGGAVYSETSNVGHLLLTTAISHSTLTNNSANTSGGVELNSGDQDLSVDNSIIAGNSGFDLQLGAPYAVTYSLIQSTDPGVVLSTADHNILGVDPQLATLALNGGTTKTMLIGPDSPAYNAGDPAFAPPPATDQRGQGRVYGIVDIGAVEWHPALAVTGDAPQPETPLIGLLMLFIGIALVTASRMRQPV